MLQTFLFKECLILFLISLKFHIKLLTKNTRFDKMLEPILLVFAPVAQSAEHNHGKVGVSSSILLGSFSETMT